MRNIWRRFRSAAKDVDRVAFAALIVSCAALYMSARQTAVMTEALTSSDKNHLVEQAMESTFAICDQFSALADQAASKQGASIPADFDRLFSKAKQNWRYAAFWLREDQARQAMIYLLEITDMKLDSGFDAAYSKYLAAKSEYGPQDRTEVYRKYSASCQKSAVAIFAAVMDNPRIGRAIGELLPISN